MPGLNVSHKYKTCYIHIPKTGGSTIEYVLFGRDCVSEHCMIEYYDTYYNYFIFSIVRNPYTRIISIYNYYINGGDQSEYDKKLVNKNTTLDDFLINYNYENLNHLCTQFTFLKNSKHINYIAKFEDYHNEIKKICNVLNIEISTIPHKRKTEYINNIIITPKFINLVNDLYKEDFTNYDYKMITLKDSINYNDFKKILT